MPEKGDQFDISEIIGMIIALLAILYSFGSSIYEVFRKRSPDEQTEEPQAPDIYEELQQQEALIEEEEEFEQPEEVVVLPPPPPMPASLKERDRKPEEKFIFQSHLDEFKPTTAIDTRHLEISLNRPESLVSHEVVAPIIEAPKPITTKKESSIHELLKRFGKKGELVIATEIILPPVGLRKLK